MLYFLPIIALLHGCTPESDVDTDTDTDTDTDSDVMETADIAGTWADNWGSYHVIDTNVWLWDSDRYLINTVNNEEQWLLAKNGSENSFFGGLWSRFDWIDVNGSLWYCHATFDAATEEEALQRPPPERTMPESDGCNGFAWSQFLEPLRIRGRYLDDQNRPHSITEKQWVMESGTARFTVDFFDNEQGVLIAQNAETNTESPSLWSRFDWVFDNDTLYACHTANAENSAEKAIQVPAAYDTNPSQTGCNGTSWLVLTEAE